MIVKSIMSQYDALLVTDSAEIQPGQLFSDVESLTGDASALDRQATAIMYAIFGIKPNAIPINSAVDEAQTKPMQAAELYASQRSLINVVPDKIRTGIENIMDCVSDEMESVTNDNISITTDQCWHVVVENVRDNVIGGISELQARIGLVANTLAPIGTSISGNLAGHYAEKLATSAEATHYASSLAQIALRMPAVTGHAGSDEVVNGLTKGVNTYLYDNFMGNFDTTTENLFDLVGGEEAANWAIAGGSEAILEAGRATAQNVAGLRNIYDRMEALGEQFGGTPSKKSSEIPFLDGSTIAVDSDSTPENLCSNYPEVGSGAAEFGFSSCVDFVEPFFDPVFGKTVLQPMVGQFSSLDFKPCQLDPSSSACESVLSKMDKLFRRLNGALSGYRTGEYQCDEGYKGFSDILGQLMNCAFASLTYKTDGLCYAGSRPAPFYNNDNNICIYYSRDYSRHDTCIDNYEEVVFEDKVTCRWYDLPINSPAVYVVNIETGDRKTIIR